MPYVLVVEDDPGVAAVLQDLLLDEGYRVTVNVDGQGLAAARADPPDLVLLDVMMPGMDGVEVCRRLRADPRTAAVPVLFLTAVPPDTLTPQVAAYAPRAILRKPFGLAEVRDTVARHTVA